MSAFYKSFIVLLLGILVIAGCKREPALQPVTPANMYKIPQGNQPYDDTIMAFYKEYGSYILYKFTQTEFKSGFDAGSVDSALQGMPEAVGRAISVFKEHCLKHYPEAFRKTTMPFVIMLSSGLFIYKPESQKFFYEDASCRATDKSFTLGFVNSDLLTKGNDYLNTCTGNMHRYYMTHAILNGRIRVPEAFRKLTPTNVWGVTDFYAVGLLEEDMSLSPVVDLGCYIKTITTHTFEEMQSLYFAPGVDKKGLIQKKYNIAVNYFKDSCDIDLQAIGNVHPK
jgi:hypothetical protein